MQKKYNKNNYFTLPRLSLSIPAVRSEFVVMMTSWVGPGLVVAMDTLGLSAVGGLAEAGRGGRGDGGRTWLSGTGCSTHTIPLSRCYLHSECLPFETTPYLSLSLCEKCVRMLLKR